MISHGRLVGAIAVLEICAAAQLPPRQPRKPKNEEKEPATQTLPIELLRSRSGAFVRISDKIRPLQIDSVYESDMGCILPGG